MEAIGFAPVAHTGQPDSYSDYDDGYYQTGISAQNPRFIDNSDGTVTDSLTGLIWLQNAGCFGRQTWAGALSACNTLASPACGLTDDSVAGDWRLPDVVTELSYINCLNLY